MAREKRTPEAKISEIDAKIAQHKANISTLEAKKEAILNPKPRTRKPGLNAIIKQAKDMGMTPEEIAKKLGLK